MVFLMIFSGVILSIIKANGWIIVPTFCVIFCYFIGFYVSTIYSYAKGIAEKINIDNAKKLQDFNKNV